MKQNILAFIIVLGFLVSLILIPSSSVKAKGFLSYPCATCSNGVCPLGGSGGECTDTEVPDMSDIGIPPEARQVMIGNCSVYKGVATELGVPWQMLMAIHYREGGGNVDQSLLNGGALCNDGDHSQCDACNNGITLDNDARCATQTLLNKAATAKSNGWANGDLSVPDDNTVKWAFYLYNGYTYETPDDRAYVMSRYPGSSAPSDANPGTFTIYAKLVKRF